MNTNKIITAYKETEPKIKIINDLSKEIETTQNKKSNIFSDINRTFQVIFHNFSTTRIKTGLKIGWKEEKEEEKQVVYINKDGISIRSDNGDGSTTNVFSYGNDMFIGFLKSLKEKELDVMQHIKKKQKQDILHNFLEDIELLDTKGDYEKSFNQLTFTDEDEEIITDRLIASSRNVEYEKSESSWNSKRFDISSHNTGFRDKIIIEQIFEELKVMLEEFLAKEKQALKNAELFFDGIKNKFNAQLMVAELKKQK